MAGIAAGDDPVFGGVAPGAELLIIKTDFQNAHIADAVVYAFNYARSMGRPAVVNLSLGGHSDAHDGTDPLSRIIDRESGPGRIVCCAAGNEGNDNIHALCVVPPHTTVSARFRVPASGIRNAELNGWYAGAAALEVGVVSPGHFRTPLQAVLPAGNPLRSYPLGDARVRVATPGPNPDNGDHQFLVDMRGPTAGTTVAAGVWKLVIKNPTAQPVTVHVWTLDDQGEQVIFTGQSVNDGFKIGSPGAAAEAITVASYTSRDTWIDAVGNTQQVGLPVGAISDFSSEGPLRSNAQKPDLMAPGAMIVAPRSSFATTRPAEQLSLTFRVMAGTSMATPYISGIVALMLQQNPTLTPAAIKQRLFAGCRLIGNAPGVWDPKQGHGLVQL